MTYKLMNDSFGNPSGVKKPLESGEILHIPLAPANTDYQEYLRWCEQGNTPLPADEEQT